MTDSPGRPPRLSHSSWTMHSCLLSCCFTSTEARWPIRDGDRVGRGRQSEGSTAETARKRPERPWTAARTMEVLKRCPIAIAQRLVHSAIALSTTVLDRVTKTMSVAPLLMKNLDNSKQKTSNLLSPAPPPYSWSLLGIFDLAWNPDSCLALVIASWPRKLKGCLGEGVTQTPSTGLRHPSFNHCRI